MNAPAPRLEAIHRLADIAAGQLGPSRPPPPPDLEAAANEALMLVELAAGNAELTGDGTATTIVMSRAMIDAALAQIAAGAAPDALLDALDEGAKAVDRALRAKATPVKGEALTRVLTLTGVASGLAKAVSDAVTLVGPAGSLTVGPSSETTTYWESPDGVRLERGCSPYFLTDLHARVALLEEPLILLVDGKLSPEHALARPLELAAAAGRPLLIVAAIFTPEALAMLAVNKLVGAVQVCPVKVDLFDVDRWRGRLDDLAAITGAKVLAPEALAQVQSSDFGGADEVRAEQDFTDIIGGHAREGEVAARIEALADAMTGAASDRDKDRALRNRQTPLITGGAVVRLGEEHAQEAPASAIAAARSAAGEGVILGGGAALAAAARALGHAPADEALRAALEAPCRHIARNAGIDDQAVLAALVAAPAGYGLNATTGAIEDLAAAGIVDLVATQCWGLARAVTVTRRLLRDPAFLATASTAPSASAAPPAGAPLRPPAQAAPSARPETATAATAGEGLSVVLTDCGALKISVIQELRAIRPELSLSEAKALVEAAPQTVVCGLAAQDAELVRERLTRVGARVEVGHARP